MRILSKSEKERIPPYIRLSECASGYDHHWVAWYNGFACYHCQVKSLNFDGRGAVLKSDLVLIPPDKLRSLCRHGDGNHWWKKVPDGRGHLVIYCHYCAGEDVPEVPPKKQKSEADRRRLIASWAGMTATLRPVSPQTDVRLTPLWQETEGHCVYCNQLPGRDNQSRDHVWPKSKGGTLARSNLVPACRPCNGRRNLFWPPSELAHPKWREYVRSKENSTCVQTLRQNSAQET